MLRSQIDFLIYAVHALAWASFGVTRLLVSRGQPAPAPAATSPLKTAPYSRALVAFHMFGFFVLYFGLGDAVIGQRVPDRFPHQRLAGALVIAVGAALASWALVYFRSWRIRAQLEPGHELATDGPFRLIRNPIYAALDLFALGTALWVPTCTELAALILIAAGGDLRARGEEKILTEAFGEGYRRYAKGTSRFIPGIY